jgi:hypothetical protein
VDVYCATRSPAIKQSSLELVSLSVASVLLAVLIPRQFVATIASWTGLSWVSAWGTAVIAKEVVALALICAIVLFWERKTLVSIGLRATSLIDIVGGLATFVLSIIIPTVVSRSQ